MQAMADWYAQPFPVIPEIGLEEIAYDIRALRMQNVGVAMMLSEKGMLLKIKYRSCLFCRPLRLTAAAMCPYCCATLQPGLSVRNGLARSIQRA